MKNKIKYLYNSIPVEIRKFLLRAIFLFIIWETIYLFLLFDNRIIDEPLTNHISKSTSYFLNLSTNNKSIYSVPVTDTVIFEGNINIMKSSEIKKGNTTLLYIADGCNGLELFLVYIGFIICFNHYVFNKLIFITIGIFTIDVINIIRCVLLAFVKEKYNEYFDFTHHYLFNSIVYLMIFILWFQFTKSKKLLNFSN